MFSSWMQGSRRTILIRAGVLIAVIAVIDWRFDLISLGFLYLLPMLLLGMVLTRWQIAAVAAACTVLVELFDTFPWVTKDDVPRDVLVFAGLVGMGLLSYQETKNREVTARHIAALENEVELRRTAEEELKILVESSPAAIMIIDSGGTVLLANEAAHRLLGLPADELCGSPIGPLIPALASVPPLNEHAQPFRTVMQCRGKRSSGEVFLADVWFSTYRTMSGARLAAMIVDTSEDLREREEFSLQQMLAGSRILVSAVSHEVRNVCGAIAVVHANLARHPGISGNEDFEALGRLVQGLEKIASMELRQGSAAAVEGVDLPTLIDELRIIIEPSFKEAGIVVHCTVDSGLPLVRADRQSLLQVFLNLAKNSERAMRKQPRRELSIRAWSENGRVSIAFQDTGSGVQARELLFRPFQRGAEATGLGLFLSRAFVRSFRGDLRYEPGEQGARFVVDLAAFGADLDNGKQDGETSNSAARRPYSVSREPEPAARDRA
jgi:two-component system, LuxR family, sensor kinase FixL